MLIRDAGKDPWFLSCFVWVPGESAAPRAGRLQIQTGAPYVIYLNGERVPNPEREITLAGGLNRLIAIVRGTGGDLAIGMIFRHADGTYMKDLEYRMTLNEVEPK